MRTFCDNISRINNIPVNLDLINVGLKMKVQAMRMLKQKKYLLQACIGLWFAGVAAVVCAEDLLSQLTDQNHRYIGPTVEDNIILMDKDKNGFADVYEVRAFLELKHGKGYEKELLDKLESSAKGSSCSTPFAKDLYSDQTSPNQLAQPK